MHTKSKIICINRERVNIVGKINMICFDKTGTLTKGELTISKIYNYSNLKENEIIRIVASIENKSEHPIARAIVNEAKITSPTLTTCPPESLFISYLTTKESPFFTSLRKSIK